MAKKEGKKMKQGRKRRKRVKKSISLEPKRSGLKIYAKIVEGEYTVLRFNGSLKDFVKIVEVKFGI
jgi:hypothetical protein